MITKDEYKTVSEYLVSQLDFDKIYEDTASTSKKMFSKDNIINSVKELILRYPHSFDTSIKGRIEMNVSTLKVHFGMLNNYIYLFSNAVIHYTKNGWFMTEDVLMQAVNFHKLNNDHFVIFNYKEYLRNTKLKKICQTITQTTNSVQK